MLALQLVAGLVLLLIGGELLVRGAVAAARRIGISPLLIGLTLVGFGTSTPELVTSLQAAFADSPGIAVGNVVGSNIANILLILGLAALLFPVAVAPGPFRRDGTVLVVSQLACAGLIVYGSLARIPGLVFLAALIGYVVFCYLQERRGAPPDDPHVHEAEETAAPAARLPVAIGLAIAGLVLTILGARFLVGGSIALATAAGISETVIGLTIVAVGTSLPELVTSVVAALRRHADVALGNIVGSNIYNVFGILGVTALVEPIPVPAEIIGFDVWVMLAATALLVAFAVTGRRITRVEGGILMAGYAAYLLALAGGV